MSAYTPELLRDYIDYVDAMVRDALENGKMGQIYAHDRYALVSFI
jgi:hypothetical protein